MRQVWKAVVSPVVVWTGILRQAGRGRVSCGGVGHGRRGKFERGMVGLVAAGKVRYCGVSCVVDRCGEAGVVRSGTFWW